jgi:hypothetical protein
MAETIEYKPTELDPKPFADIAGEDVVSFIFEHAPQKVTTRVARALDHYTKASALVGVDEEMGAIRLIAAEEELVVAIFEWLKLKEDQFPENKDFVRKFKNHVVKLAFYPVLAQFRFILSDMLKNGFAPDGLEDVINWTTKPVIDGDRVKLALIDAKGKEIIRHNPLAVDLSQGEVRGKDVVPLLLADLTEMVKTQRNMTLKEFIFTRADFRNELLYASDAGSVEMGDTLTDLIDTFKETYNDLLWVLAILINGEPPSKEWGLGSQFSDLYREVRIVAGVLRSDNTVAEVEVEPKAPAPQDNKAQ